MSEQYTILSLFDGISGGHIALERANVPIKKYYASEINKWAIGIAKYNYPDIIEVGDVRDLTIDKLDKIDVLIGGSPCQNFSFSGRRQGASTLDGIEILDLKTYLKYKNDGVAFDGYSYLFWEYVRLLNELKPKYFFLENVKMQKKWESVITKTLDVEPLIIDSALITAQKRNRLYWTNIPLKERLEDKEIYLKDVLLNTYTEKEEVSELIKSRYVSVNNKSWIGEAKPASRKIGQRNRVYGDNNKLGTLCATDYKEPKLVMHNGVLRRISPVEAEILQTLPTDYTKYGIMDGKKVEMSNTRRYEVIGNGWTIDVVASLFKGLS